MQHVCLLQGSSASLGKSGGASKAGKGPGSKAKDPIQERKEAQLADEAQVLTLAWCHHTLTCCDCCSESPFCVLLIADFKCSSAAGCPESSAA